jgi:hypothetical protein
MESGTGLPHMWMSWLIIKGCLADYFSGLTEGSVLTFKMTA